MIKTSGANVSPREVEAAIRDLTGLTAHVIGIADDARGQVVAAAVRVPAGRVVNVDELRERLAARLSAYKVPRRFLLLARRRGPRAVERQARPARARGAVRCRADAWTIPRLIARRRAGRSRGSRRSSSDDRSITYAELDDASRALASRMVRAGRRARATASAC